MSNQTKLAVIDSALLATQKEMRDSIKRSDRLVKVQFANIKVRKGFNLREDFGDIEALADSIESEGLQKPLVVDILKDNSAVLTDGERRFRALSILVKRSKELAERFEYVEAYINDKEMSEADRVIAMMVHNSGKPFEVLEEAEGFRRLKDEYGMSMKDIASRIGKPVPYVEQRLLLANADDDEKDNIRSNKISPTAQVELMRREKNPTKRKATVNKATAAGKKVKVKDVKVPPMVTLCEQGIALVKKADAKVKDGTVTNLLFEIDAKFREIKKAAKA